MTAKYITSCKYSPTTSLLLQLPTLPMLIGQRYKRLTLFVGQDLHHFCLRCKEEEPLTKQFLFGRPIKLQKRIEYVEDCNI